MNTIVINSGMFSDDLPIKAAFEAADILRKEYSMTVFIKLENHTDILGFDGTPQIRIGSDVISLDEIEDYNEAISLILDRVLEAANVKSGAAQNETLQVNVRENPSQSSGAYALN
ncbi:MAG: hypothetical protein G5Z42_06620 [Caldisphaeraceae archaeon]|nr:hypothetical protein [Caldisphaeraceae archaeon]MEB3691740.1 hypothetical protein [Caldisphaeraceae archaeon]MEB3798472.1 hypothetical protein [Caldisphaeraceae archaeon]